METETQFHLENALQNGSGGDGKVTTCLQVLELKIFYQINCTQAVKKAENCRTKHVFPVNLVQMHSFSSSRDISYTVTDSAKSLRSSLCGNKHQKF